MCSLVKKKTVNISKKKNEKKNNKITKDWLITGGSKERTQRRAE